MELVRSDALGSAGLRAETAPAELAISVGAFLTTPVTARKNPPKATPRVVADEECLVPDWRAAVSPAQAVERRLAVLLQGSAMPVSHVRLAARIGRKP
jgi:hypothetical protein